MRIIFFIFLSSLSLLAQSNHLSDSLLFRGFNKIVCINAPEDPVALNLSDRQIDDINYAIMLVMDELLPVEISYAYANKCIDEVFYPGINYALQLDWEAWFVEPDILGEKLTGYLRIIVYRIANSHFIEYMNPNSAYDVWLGVPFEEIFYEDGALVINYSFEEIKEKMVDMCRGICESIALDRIKSP
ncbi:MAG: hypothetical protein VX818_04060 [Candidatus Neomarinimicrobiota bacterium]|nr:hypothetical protein [Candidatus Neomarinimicrobiota bacterium]